MITLIESSPFLLSGQMSAFFLYSSTERPQYAAAFSRPVSGRVPPADVRRIALITSRTSCADSTASIETLTWPAFSWRTMAAFTFSALRFQMPILALNGCVRIEPPAFLISSM